ncbi:Flagellar biosynthetic protein FlhB [Bacillus sp. THAF10]|uniref:EscU/YscU/HrcU family type III secretion system export apparatus switch protein n=1 Tax=Bacillus sp. THAF10 TaxID=2587848 RepID=UPI001268D20E|nr:EscU/YscU/HrcU family type III secretion system export apparatus switch protein [Bacillus sp. THAF10]QFT88852.1 Flagellar biosynthetic protein FlhB [Bacillus sp. THAF10]
MTDEREKRIKAVALKYEQSKKSAPVVNAKGAGLIANNILREAEKNNIPIQKDEALIELLMQVELNDTIPEELYEVIAEVLAYVYSLHSEEEKNVKKGT